MRFVYLLTLVGISVGLIAAPVQAEVKRKAHHTAKVVPVKHATKAVHKSVVKPKRFVKTPKPAAPKIAVPAIVTTVGASQLNNQLNTIVNTTNARGNVAIYVKSMVKGDALYSRNINQALTPASTLKILTAEAALLYLKPEYRFSTQLLTDAKTIKNGVLQGNLYVVLSGDPSLTSEDVIELMETLKTQQVQAVAGNVYIDNTAYDERFYGPDWERKDKESCYGAPISASIINHNCLPIKIVSKNTDTAQPVRTQNCTLRIGHSLTGGLEIESCAVSSSGKKKKVETGFSYVVTDIPEYNRALFKSVLNQLGVRVYGTVTFGSAPQNLSLVGGHASAPLRELIHHMLKKSDNIIAGAIFKKLGQLYNHQPGSWENGSIAVSEILARNAGVNTSGMRILDGSGLSSSNLTSAEQMMRALDFAFHAREINNDFISSLPIAGVDGTLKHRMSNIAYKVRAKTGTMPLAGVVGLAGYVISADREPLAFVILINGMPGMGWRYKGLEDQIATALTKFKRG